MGGMFYVRDPDFWNSVMKAKVVYGWNYLVSLTTSSSDYNRQFVLISR
jgi:hypothetical protein